ncbi:hypothetical protein BDV40DRAFT_269375 [Aspergillus tamarii]|uniref:Uncharacterized protein n=1 Tax=Aspergillus tamarii TaxID=41984 RepID=A0A5N6UQI1_ASPTM|nr:hypothetical protein BDV40DRAFT_269375 [Aspergillus tamarii]
MHGCYVGENVWIVLICRYFVSCLLGWAYVLSCGMAIICSVRSSLSDYHSWWS